MTVHWLKALWQRCGSYRMAWIFGFFLAPSETSGQQAIPEGEHVLVVPIHTSSRKVIPKSKNIFDSERQGSRGLVLQWGRGRAFLSAVAPKPANPFSPADKTVFAFLKDLSAAPGVAMETEHAFVFWDDLSG